MAKITYDAEDLIHSIRYPEECGWYVDEENRLVWLAEPAGHLIDHEEMLNQSLGKLYAFGVNPNRYRLGHTQEKPSSQLVRNARWVWRVRGYIHSEISLAPSYTANYQHYDAWDSGDVGLHIVTLKDVYQWYPRTEWQKMTREEQEKWVMDMVRQWYKEYNDWLNGWVYYIEVFRIPDSLLERYKKYGTHVFIRAELAEENLDVDGTFFFASQVKGITEWMDAVIEEFGISENEEEVEG